MLSVVLCLILMDNQAINTDDGAASVGRTPGKKRSPTTRPSQLADAGASSSSAAGTESSNRLFVS